MSANTRRAPCPQCNRGPKDTALAITTDERGEVWLCHRCGYRGSDNGGVREHVRQSVPKPVQAASLDKLVAIWARTQPLRGTLGQTYLQHRRCVLPPVDSDVRYLPSSAKYPPSLCSLVTDPVTAAPMTLHFTRLAADGRGKAGTECDKKLLKKEGELYGKAGGVIRVYPNDSVTRGLAIAEGIETALSVAHAYTPVWSTVDAGNMTKFPVLNGIESLLIFADNDAAGLAAARACGSRWAAAGRDARLVIPPEGDFNDVVVAA